MTPTSLAQQFADQVKMRAYKDKYIDQKEEQDILQMAINAGISFDNARSALTRICEDNQYVLESVVLDKVKELLETFMGNDGKLDEKEFKDAVSVCVKSCLGRKNELECKRMVIQLIESGAMAKKVKTGWFSNWYAAAKKDVGLA
jgi:hypothetical protein